MTFLRILQFLFLLNVVNGSNPSTLPAQQELGNALKLLPSSVRESARSYIASRLRRVVLIPPQEDSEFGGVNPPQNLSSLTYDLTTLSNSNSRKKRLYNPHGKRMLGSHLVPVIPEDVQTPKWIPGELIASQISKRDIQIINESMFGPLKSVTMFPSIQTSILVFKRRYNPERLAQILKYNFGVEAEPNGVIIEAP